MPTARRGERPLATVLLASVMVLAAVACPAFFANGGSETGDPDQGDGEDLPSTAEECLALARRLGQPGASAAELQLALRAFERAETLEGEDLELAIEEARLVALIAEPLAKSTKVVRWLDRGDGLVDRILDAAPERVEGHYYKAVFLGLRAQIQTVGGLDLVPAILESARRAAEIDEAYDDAGPLVALGTVLVKAPAWPNGVGDAEEGLEVLQRAVDISDYPVNRLMLGASLIDNGQKTAGCRELVRVLAAPKRGRWAKTGAQYREQAELLMRSNRCPRTEGSP